MFPSNEAETIELYKLVQAKLGWTIVHLQTAFPDAVIENGNGKQLVAEFEYLAGNFKDHKHDPSGCDLIICWRNNWPDAPLPVWALEERANGEAALIAGIVIQERANTSRLNSEVSHLRSEVDHYAESAEHWEGEYYSQKDSKDYWYEQSEKFEDLLDKEITKRARLEGQLEVWRKAEPLKGDVYTWIFVAFVLGSLATLAGGLLI